MKRVALLVFAVAVTSICSAQWLERTVTVGDPSGGLILNGGIVANPVSHNAYVESDPTQVFNPVTVEKVRTFYASGPVAFCPASGKGYILDDPVVIIDAASDTAVGTATLPFPPTLHAYSQTSNRLYLASPDDSAQLLVFDPSGDTVIVTIDAGHVVTSLLWDSSPNRLYIGTASDSGLVRVLDCEADTFVRDVRTGPMAVSLLALSPASRKLYCADANNDISIAVVSTDSLVLVDSVPGIPYPAAMVYSPPTDRLYCLGEDGDGLFVVDCRSDSVRTELDVSSAAIAASTLDGRAYLGQYDPGPVLVLDTNDAVVDSIAMPDARGNNVGALMFQPERNEFYGSLTAHYAFVIDASADSVTGLFDYVTYTPRKMEHNPAGNKLYLLCTGADMIVVTDSTYAITSLIENGAVNSYAVPVLDRSLNRLYVADDDLLRVIDCNSDSTVRVATLSGISRPLPVLVPYLNKLYVFAGSGVNDNVYAYDGLKDTAFPILTLTDAVPCAAYDSRSNRVFFACEDSPPVRVLDPTNDVVVRAFDFAGGSVRGRMAVNPDLGRLYYTDQTSDMVYTIDVLTDSVASTASLPWDIDTLLLDRRLSKLYMCSRDSAKVLVFDCRQGAIVDTVIADFNYSALMNERNDKLYLRYGAVVDCRCDSVVTVLPPGSLNPRCMAWDMIDNRVFQAYGHTLYVYRDDPYGVEEGRVASLGSMLTVLGNPVRNAINLRLQIPYGQTGSLTLYDIAGRLVRSTTVIRTSTLRLDLNSLSAGVYLVCLEADGKRTTDKVIVQH